MVQAFSDSLPKCWLQPTGAGLWRAWLLRLRPRRCHIRGRVNTGTLCSCRNNLTCSHNRGKYYPQCRETVNRKMTVICGIFQPHKFTALVFRDSQSLLPSASALLYATSPRSTPILYLPSYRSPAGLHKCVHRQFYLVRDNPFLTGRSGQSAIIYPTENNLSSQILIFLVFIYD
jgi:hypothetical protein